MHLVWTIRNKKYNMCTVHFSVIGLLKQVFGETSWIVLHQESYNVYYLLLLLDFIYRGSLFSIFTTLIYHKVLIKYKTEQDTEQDKQTQILVAQFTNILTQYI